MADNWDSAYPDFPTVAAPPSQQQQTPTPPANNSAWDQGFPNFELPNQPTKQMALPAEKDMPIFDPVSGVTYNPSDPNGPMRSAGGFMAAGGEYALAGPQLLAHGAKVISPSLAGPANGIDKAIDWLAAPGTEDYNLGRTIGKYSIPALTWPLAASAMSAPATTSAVSGTMAGGAPFTGAVTNAGGILSRLGDIGSKAASAFGLSLASRPIENADQGYWERKAEQTAADTALGTAGPIINSAGNLIKPITSGISNFVHSHPMLSTLLGSAGAGAGAAHGIEGLRHVFDYATEHPAVALSIMGALLGGKGLSSPIGQTFAAPVGGAAVNSFMNSGSAPNGLLPYLSSGEAMPF